MVDLGGYVIVLVEKDGKIKLFGSAAERNDCDEILEINGSSLDQMSHEQIIQHIHQCIKTRTICLRVKRRSSDKKLGTSIDSSLIDAFVIGSRAREHLQTLTKDANITPKDIAQLSKILSENNEVDTKPLPKPSGSENKENLRKDSKKQGRSKDDSYDSNLRKSDSGDIDYLELNDDNIQLLNINPGPNISLKKTDSQQSIVDLVKRSASISLSNTSLNKVTYNSRRQDEEEARKYIPFNRLNSVLNRLIESLDDGNLRRLIEKTNFRNLVDIYSTLMQERYINAPFVDLDSVQIHQEVIELLQNKGNVEDDFIELLEILNKFEYEGLFQVLNHVLKKRKRQQADDDVSIQEEELVVDQRDRTDSVREDVFEAHKEEEEEADIQSLIEESISSLKEASERAGYVLPKEETIRREQAPSREEAIADLEEDVEEQEMESEKLDVEVESEKIGPDQRREQEIEPEQELVQEDVQPVEQDEDELSEQLPAVPPLPMQIMNSLQLERQSSNLITTSAEMPSLSSVASAVHLISSTQPISYTQAISPSQAFTTPSPCGNQQTPTPDQVLYSSGSNVSGGPPPPQNVLQSTFLSTVNDSLSYVNTTSDLSDLSQTPYCNLQQQPNLIYSSLSASPLPCAIAANLEQQSIPTNLCNLSTATDTPIVNSNLHILSSFDLPALGGVLQINEQTIPPLLANQASLQELQNLQNLQNLQQQQQQNLQQQQSQTISALEYSNGAIPPPPQPPLTTTMPPNLNNLPPNLPPNTKLSIVRIEKHSSEPLGATVRNEVDGRVTIGRIVCGGAASKCSAALQEGDEILMVNNVFIRGKTVDQVCELLSQMQGTLTFVIAKSGHPPPPKEPAKLNANSNVQRKSSTSSHDSANSFPNCKVIHYKAFFDYNPAEDLYIPCRELGVSFRRGDLLHIIDSSDDHWWQAFKEGDTNQNLAGLIPSLKFQLMREEVAKKLEQQQQEKRQDEQIELDSLDSSINRRTTSSILSFNCSGKRSTSKKRKSRKEEFPAIYDYVPYEEVKQCMGLKRTVVLVGPNNIGRQGLRERLTKLKNQYGPAIPHTSRSKRSDERNGEDYYFVSKQQFEQYIEENKFVEYGDYGKDYYGTSYSSIEDVLKSNKTCILNLHVQSILKLRTPTVGKKFRPFIVFVAPPTNLELLRKLVESINNMPASLNELHGILNEAYEIKRHFAHFFDLILTVTDIDECFRLLLNEINSLDKEPQWIPSSWL